MVCIKGIVVSVILVVAGYVQAQDPVFFTFYLSPLQLNPGLTGLTEDPRFSSQLSQSYPGLIMAYRTYAISYDQYFRRSMAAQTLVVYLMMPEMAF